MAAPPTQAAVAARLPSLADGAWWWPWFARRARRAHPGAPPAAASIVGTAAKARLHRLPPAGLAAALARALVAEEGAVEADAGKGDVFHTPLRFVATPPWPVAGARYVPTDTPPDALLEATTPTKKGGRRRREASPPPPGTVTPPQGGGGGTHPHRIYRGPTLTALLAHPISGALVEILVPGAPEGAPDLTFGDWVHVRPSPAPRAEAVGAVVAVDGPHVLLHVPAAAATMLARWAAHAASLRSVAAAAGGGSGDAPAAPLLVHARFAPRRTRFDAAHAALAVPGAVDALVPPVGGGRVASKPPPPHAPAAATTDDDGLPPPRRAPRRRAAGPAPPDHRRRPGRRPPRPHPGPQTPQPGATAGGGSLFAGGGGRGG